MFRKNVRSKKRQEQHRKRLKRVVLITSSVMVLLFVAVVIMLNQPFMRIGIMTTTGNETVHSQDILEVAEDVLSGKTAWVFPHDTVLFYNKKNLKQDLVDSFSRLREVRVNIKGFDELHISVTEHEPEHLWCRAEGDMIGVPKNCYYMDRESYVFAKAPYFSDRVFLKFLGSQNKIPENPLRAQVFHQETFEHVIEIVDACREAGLLITKVIVEDHGDFRLYIDTLDGTRTGAETYVYLNEDMSAGEVIENLGLTFSTPSFVEQFQENPTALQYIDLRFAEKIVYRFDSYEE